MKKRVYFMGMIAGLLLCFGCSTTYDAKARRVLKFINYNDLQFDQRSVNHYVDLFFEGTPAQEYITLGRIDGFVSNHNDINPLLKAKARQVGGDAVIDIAIEYQKEDVSPAFSLGVGHGHYHHGRFGHHAAVAVPYGTSDSVKTYKISATVIRYSVKRALPVEPLS